MLLNIVAALLVSQGAEIPSSYRGNFVDRSGVAHAWTVNGFRTLIWNGKPFIPTGITLDADLARLQALDSSVVPYVLVRVPLDHTVIAKVINILDSKGIAYSLEFMENAPRATGYFVEPESFRIDRVTSDLNTLAKIPDSDHALSLQVLKQDGSVTKRMRLVPENGFYEITAKAFGNLEQVMLLYPHSNSLPDPDAWEKLDDFRDKFLLLLNGLKFGPNFRGFVNILGPAYSRSSDPLKGDLLQYVPTNPRYKAQFSRFLKDKYRSVTVALNAWGIGVNDLETFEDLSGLVPLFSGSRGLPLVWLPSKRNTYPVEMKNSRIWNDITEVVVAAQRTRTQNLIAGLRKVVDVPVIERWKGWSSTIEDSGNPYTGLLATTSDTSNSDLMEGLSQMQSTVNRWQRPGVAWLQLESPSDPPRPLQSVFDDISRIGVRGIVTDPEKWETIPEIDPSLAETTPNSVYFPYNALNPARTLRLASQKWWLPAPISGDRLDFGDQFNAFRWKQDDQLVYAIWRTEGSRQGRVRLLPTKTLEIVRPDEEVQTFKVTKTGFETILTDTPLFFRNAPDVPVPEELINRTVDDFEIVTEAALREKREISGELIRFKDLFLSIDVNPGGNLLSMRQILRKVAISVAPFTWYEAENSRDHSFSEVQIEGGCSNGQALASETVFPSPLGFYSAKYVATNRFTGAGRIWVALKGTFSDRANLKVLVNGADLPLQNVPYAKYGNGYAWYRTETMNFDRIRTTLELRISDRSQTTLSVDAIAVGNANFMPTGAFAPITPAQWFPDLVPKKARKGSDGFRKQPR